MDACDIISYCHKHANLLDSDPSSGLEEYIIAAGDIKANPQIQVLENQITRKGLKQCFFSESKLTIGATPVHARSIHNSTTTSEVHLSTPELQQVYKSMSN